jgi:hypothetical protein
MRLETSIAVDFWLQINVDAASIEIGTCARLIPSAYFHLYVYAVYRPSDSSWRHEQDR